ncbi:cell division protein ZapA [Tissierella sp. Yu-01]|uniref:cell division protein ZapA n=1 Tax=Tissierella sp. Yu-01 TaxID=3035694 RepID=UPI00240E7CCC|nr:cell division protein ZapA [Tissierella sp. Yu-01]WFA09877.1 cell division protein ZapA [Tissierella sp. Yu-01]
MPEKNKVNVIIDGRNFTVVGAGDENYVKNLAYYVDQRIKNLASKNDRLSQTMAATLAALNIADELFKTKDKLNELEKKAKEPLEKFSDLTQELEETKAKIRDLEKLCLEYKDEAIKTKLSKEEQYNEVSKISEQLEQNEIELEELRKQNKNLQDKNFQNQLELIETRKELSEVLKLFNEKK